MDFLWYSYKFNLLTVDIFVIKDNINLTSIPFPLIELTRAMGGKALIFKESYF